MMPGIDRVDALFACFFLQLINETLGNAVYTTYGRHNPYLIAHAYIAILTDITFKGTFFVFNLKRLVYRIIRIFECT